MSGKQIETNGGEMFSRGNVRVSELNPEWVAYTQLQQRGISGIELRDGAKNRRGDPMPEDREIFVNEKSAPVIEAILADEGMHDLWFRQTGFSGPRATAKEVARQVDKAIRRTLRRLETESTKDTGEKSSEDTLRTFGLIQRTFPES